MFTHRSALRVITSVAVLGLLAAGLTVSGIQSEDGDSFTLTPAGLEFEDGPASLPPGSEFVVIDGDPAEQGFFALRLRLPEGYEIPPHTHPAEHRRVTVISGTWHLGIGETFDRDAADTLPAGSYYSLAPGEPHFGWASEETVIQINNVSPGPSRTKYVDPADDPR